MLTNKRKTIHLGHNFMVTVILATTHNYFYLQIIEMWVVVKHPTFKTNKGVQKQNEEMPTIGFKMTQHTALPAISQGCKKN